MEDDVSNLIGLKPFQVVQNGKRFEGVQSEEHYGGMSEYAVTIFNPDTHSPIQTIGLCMRDYDDTAKTTLEDYDQHFVMIEVFKAAEGRWKGVLGGTDAYLNMRSLDYLTDKHAQSYKA